jgi:hypothetical protein
LLAPNPCDTTNFELALKPILLPALLLAPNPFVRPTLDEAPKPSLSGHGPDNKNERVTTKPFVVVKTPTEPVNVREPDIFSDTLNPADISQRSLPDHAKEMPTLPLLVQFLVGPNRLDFENWSVETKVRESNHSFVEPSSTVPENLSVDVNPTEGVKGEVGHACTT